MSEDFGRSLSDVMADVTMGYQGMSATVGNFGFTPPPPLPNPTDFVPPQVMAMYASSGGAPFVPIQLPQAPPPMPYVPPMSIAPTSQYQPPQPTQQSLPFMAPQMMPQMQSPYSGYGGNPMDPFGTQAALAQARSGHIQNVSYAAHMDPSMMYPGAGMMTDHSMGVFRNQILDRQRVAAPMGLGGVGPPLSMLPLTSLQRTRDMSFVRPYDAALFEGTDAARAVQQGYQSYAESAAKGVLSLGGGIAGTVIGGVAGAFAGAPMQGAGLGGLAGSFLQYMPFADDAVAAVMRPALERRYDAIQTQYSSRGHLLAMGEDTDISGSGLSTTAAQRMTRGMDSIARASGGEMNRQDVVSLIHMAGEQGLLDFAQNSDQIIKATKNVMAVVKTMSEITGDPDFQSNIQKIGKLRQLGMSAGSMNEALRNMEAYSRMAGVSVEEAMQTHGMQGAATYQNVGVAASQGMQSGVHALGLTKQLIASNAFNERDLAMYGGESGVAQLMTEVGAASVASLSKHVLPYLVDEGKDGRLSINEQRLRDLQTGKTSFDDALSAAAGRTDLSMTAWQNLAGNQRKELINELGDMSGPAGAQRMMFDAAMSMSKSTGLDVQSVLNMTVGEDAASVLMRQKDPAFQKNLLAQMNKELERRQFEASQQEAPQLGFFAKRGLGLPTPMHAAQSGWSDWLAENEESARLDAVGVRRSVRRDLQVGGTSTREAILFARDNQIGEGEAKAGLFDEDLSYRDALSGRSGVVGLAQRLAGRTASLSLPGDGTGYTYGGAMTTVRAGAKIADWALALDEDAVSSADKLRRAYGGAFSDDELKSARASLRKKVGDDKAMARAQVVLGQKMSSAVGMGVLDPSAISVDEMRGLLPEGVYDSLSPAEQRALLSSSAMYGGPDAEEYMKYHNEQANLAVAVELGREYMGAGGGAAATAVLTKVFGKTWAGQDRSVGDLSETQRVAIETVMAVGGENKSERAYYLVLAAALQSEGPLKNAALTIAERLAAANGEEHDVKMSEAMSHYRSLTKEQKEALIAEGEYLLNIPTSNDKIGIARGTKDVQESKEEAMKLLKGVSGAASYDKTLTSLKGAAAKLREGGAAEDARFGRGDTPEGYAMRMQRATGDTKAAFQKQMGKDNFARFQSLDLTDEAQLEVGLDMLGSLGPGGSGELDMKTKGVGATNDSIESQKLAIEAQQAFFGRLNDAVSDNVNALQENTKALRGLDTKAKDAVNAMKEDTGG